MNTALHRRRLASGRMRNRIQTSPGSTLVLIETIYEGERNFTLTKSTARPIAFPSP